MQNLRLSIIGTTFIAAFSLAGCSSTPSTPSAPATPTQMVFKQGATASYTETTLDTTAGEPAVAGSAANETSIVAAINQSWLGNTGVAFEVLTDPNLALPDTMFYSQSSNMDLSQYSYLNYAGFAQVLAYAASNQINLPFPTWEVQAKMGAASGTFWLAWDTTFTVNLGITATAIMIDSATMMGDTTVKIGTNSYAVKHAVHRLNVSIPVPGSSPMFSFTESFDTYVSATLGATVINIGHTGYLYVSSVLASVSGLSGGNTKLQGASRIMTAHS